MAKRRTRKTPKSKWARKVNRKPKKAKRGFAAMTKQQKATFAQLIMGGTVDESE